MIQIYLVQRLINGKTKFLSMRDNNAFEDTFTLDWMKAFHYNKKPMLTQDEKSLGYRVVKMQITFEVENG